jgi:hypothetical protein
MVTIALVLLIAAFIVFLLAACNFPWPPRINPLGLGLALWTLSLLIERIKF